MQEIFFYIFAALALACGALVILNRNPVNSAMFLVLSIISLAGLFVLLHAFFLAAVQVVVYAGAVIVLFLFVIMLLDLKAEERRKINAFGAATGVLSVLAIGFVFWRSLWHSSLPNPTAMTEGGTLELGRMLFTSYALPFEILSVLLLVAMVGVILLSKKGLK
ncbi:MAG: NADH:ubiquinone oxidoreductase subunit 6 [Pedosphaera sp.]|nr:NADH:ubiquinone oxidoreductase subunit 6 [Pedosphaera sp.]